MSVSSLLRLQSWQNTAITGLHHCIAVILGMEKGKLNSSEKTMVRNLRPSWGFLNPVPPLSFAYQYFPSSIYLIIFFAAACCCPFFNKELALSISHRKRGGLGFPSLNYCLLKFCSAACSQHLSGFTSLPPPPPPAQRPQHRARNRCIYYGW